MKNKFFNIISFLIIGFLVSCSSKKETPVSVAQKWCELNAKAYKADESAKETAEMARDKFEKEIETKYNNDKAFMDELEKEIEKCENASEGRD